MYKKIRNNCSISESNVHDSYCGTCIACEQAPASGNTGKIKLKK